MTLGERIRELRKKKDRTQQELADRLDMSLVNYGRMERDQLKPSLERLEQIAKVFGVDAYELLKPEGVYSVDKEKVAYYPILGEIRAGEPIFIKDNIVDYIPVLKGLKLVPPGEIYALRVKGSSMAGEGIRDGNYILFRKQDYAENRDIVIVLVNGDVVIRKYYQRNENVVLEASGSEYEPIIITSKTEFTILGKVVLNMAKFK